jgi:hypothetical protein
MLSASVVSYKVQNIIFVPTTVMTLSTRMLNQFLFLRRTDRPSCLCSEARTSSLPVSPA